MYFKSTSLICCLVFPSKTSNCGAAVYPLPREFIPIDSKEARVSISSIVPKLTSALTVVSTGKLYPILSILVLVTLPIVELATLTIAPAPVPELTVVIPGRE